MPTNRIELYTRSGCSQCSEAKIRLQDHGLSWTEYQIGSDVLREDVIQRYPEAKVLPVVVIDGRYIGGKDQLYDYLRKTSLTI